MDMSQSPERASTTPSKKLRRACDFCHQTKVRCSGENPCKTCENLDMECVYSVSNRAGRPRGTRNKRTFERLGKSSSSGQHEQNNAGNVEENAIPQQEAIEKDSSDPGSRSTRLPELRTQMETSQSIEQSFHAPTSAGLIQDIDALDHSFPPNDESLLAMMDPMAGWPLYNDLAGFSTSAVPYTLAGM